MSAECETMKIILTTHLFLPDFSSGTEVLTFSTAKELQRQGHRVEVVTGFLVLPGSPIPQRFDSYEYEGIQVRRFFYNSEPVGAERNIVEEEYNNTYVAHWFQEILKYFKPDIVHFFHLAFLSASVVDECQKAEIPRVMTPTDFWLICPTSQLRLPGNALCRGPDKDGVNCMRHAVFNHQPRYIARIFNRLPRLLIVAMIWGANHGLFSWSKLSPMVRALNQRTSFLKRRMNMLDRVIAPTYLMEQMLVANGLSQNKVVFSRFGISATESVPKSQLQQTDKLRIGFIGGLTEHKGAHLLISAIRLLQNMPSLELKIYGNHKTDPQYFKKLTQLAYEDQRIHFCGTFPNELIGEIFSELDVLVVPSIWYENTPLVIYSAQAAGCPVLATNLGGMAEVVEHEKNGLLFEAGDVTGIANTIKRLALDRGLLKRLAGNAKAPKAISIYVAELLVIYHDVLNPATK